MTKINYNLEWRYRKSAIWSQLSDRGKFLIHKVPTLMQKKTFHYASHAWSLPTVRHSLTAGNQIHRLQKQIKSPNCSRQYTENETKPLGINFFRGIQRFCVISGFALAAVMGRRKGKDPSVVEASFSPTALSKEGTLSPGSSPKQWKVLKMPQI